MFKFQQFRPTCLVAKNILFLLSQVVVVSDGWPNFQSEEWLLNFGLHSYSDWLLRCWCLYYLSELHLWEVLVQLLLEFACAWEFQLFGPLSRRFNFTLAQISYFLGDWYFHEWAVIVIPETDSSTKLSLIKRVYVRRLSRTFTSRGDFAPVETTW